MRNERASSALGSAVRYSSLRACGALDSSREHAAWALVDYGFRVVIAPSFADIFRNNVITNGLAPVVMPESAITIIAGRAQSTPAYTVDIDLEAQRVRDDDGLDYGFALDDAARHRLLHGLDDIGMILQHEHAIARYEEQQRRIGCRH